MSPHRRAAASILAEPLVLALDLLPHGIAPKQYQSFYPNKNFKRVVDWTRAAKLMLCIAAALDVSGGLQVKLVAMRQAVGTWSYRHSLDLNADVVDDIAYSLRAVISQLYNMKSKGRPIPSVHRATFTVAYDKLKLSSPAASSSTTSNAATQQTAPIAKQTDLAKDVVEISEGETISSDVGCSQDEWGYDKSELFSSDNKELAKILSTKRRLQGKQHCADYPIRSPKRSKTSPKLTASCAAPVAASSLDALEKLAVLSAPTPFAPATWAGINKSFKDKTKKKKKKSKSSKKKQRAMKTGSNKVRSAVDPSRVVHKKAVDPSPAVHKKAVDPPMKVASTKVKAVDPPMKAAVDPPMKAASKKAINPSWDAHVHREHSKAYHKMKRECELAGMSAEAAKERARAAGRARKEEVLAKGFTPLD
jgi:hypothetical protein